MIHITKVVSRNFIMDIVARIQNLIGKNLSAYEDMVNKGMKQIEDQLDDMEVELKWFRYEITQLTIGAVCITLYGEEK